MGHKKLIRIVHLNGTQRSDKASVLKLGHKELIRLLHLNGTQGTDMSSLFKWDTRN